MTRKTIPKEVITIRDDSGDNVPENFDFPSIGIEDIDRAIFDLFDKQLNIETDSNGEVKKVDVIFSTGERFALTRRKNPIRDKNNANILPLISIMRENFDIGPNQHGLKTPISVRAHPDYTIKIRLSEKDRNFQNIINKMNLKNQENVSSKNNFLDTSSKIGVNPGTVATRRTNDITFSKGAAVSLKDNINKNIYEIIQVPYPIFIASTYNITFWSQYLKQGNEMIEYFLNKISSKNNEFLVKTSGGYNLVAYLGDDITFENNFDNMTDDERIIKYSFSLTVPGYLLNSKIPGLSNRARSYYSAPVIDFTYKSINRGSPVLDYRPETEKEKIERFTLTDVTSEDSNELQRGESNEVIEVFVKNPFSGETEVDYLRIKSSNARVGERVISTKGIKEIDRQYE